MNDTTVTPEELPVSAPAVSEQPDPVKELEAVRTGTVSVRTEDYTENLLFAEEIGKVKASRAVASALDLSVVRWFDFMKNSKVYKGKQFIGPDNKPFSAENFEQFCEGMGFSYDKIYHDIQNLSTFGEERLTEIRNLGLTVRDTRKIRKAIKDVDEDTKKEIFRELKSSTPEELRVTIDVICAQHAKAQADNKKLEKEAEKLKEKVEALEKDKEAQQKVAQERNDQIAALKEELIVVTSSAIADVEVKKMKKNANNREIIDEKCRDAVFAVASLAAFGSSVLADDENSEETAAYVHERISSAVRGMAVHILSAGIDVDLTAELVPDFGPDFGEDLDGEPFPGADDQEPTD